MDYASSLFVYKHKHVDQVRTERVHRREVTKVRFFNEKGFFFKKNKQSIIHVISIAHYAVLYFHDKSLLLIKKLSVHTNTYSGIRKKAPLSTCKHLIIIIIYIPELFHIL